MTTTTAVRTLSGPSVLPPQVRIARSHAKAMPCRDCLQPITNYSMKPRGGLWTSTYSEDDLCEWYQWCLSDGEGEWVRDNLLWVLFPRRSNIVTIDHYDDLLRLARVYGQQEPLASNWTRCLLDFEAMVRDGIDAIHLTEHGEHGTRYGPGFSLDKWNLYGWDCESTLWLRWRFQRIEYLGRCSIKDWQHGQHDSD